MPAIPKSFVEVPDRRGRLRPQLNTVILQRQADLVQEFSCYLSLLKSIECPAREYREAYDQARDRFATTWKKAWKRKPLYLASTLDRIDEIFEERRWQWWTWKAVLEELLNELAQLVQFTPGPCWIKWQSTSAGDYRSQPAAAFYARGRAFMYAEEARWHGIAVRVQQGKGETDLSSFDVMVQLNPVLVEVLNRRYDYPTELWLQSAWSHGCNARVFWPMLPYGLEEKLGVSYLRCRQDETLYEEKGC